MLHLLGTFFLLALHVHSLRASSPIVVSKASREGTRERVSGGCTCVSFRVFVCNSYVTSGEKSSLARSLPSRFSRTNRRACSQASLQANLNGALNQALGMGQTSQKQFSDKHSVVSFNFSGLWTLLCPLRPPTGMCSACYCIKRINDMSFDLQFLSRSHQKTLVIFREGRQLKT